MREQLRQLPATRLDVSRNIEIEFDVAGDTYIAAAECETVRVRHRLGCDTVQQTEHLPRQSTAFGITCRRTLRQPRIDQPELTPDRLAMSQTPGHSLGFDQQPQFQPYRRKELLQEPRASNGR